MVGVSIDHRNIASLFIIKALDTPDCLAIADSNFQLSYQELLCSVCALAADIEVMGPRAAAIIIERGVCVPIAMIACLTSGVPFVTIDPSYPKQRIADILRISSADIILTSNKAPAKTSERPDYGSVNTIYVDYAGLSMRPINEIKCRYNEIAYFIFTSGTTGFPKGIKTGHGPLRHFIDWYLRKFDPTPGSRFSMLSGLSHDPVLRDVFVPLSMGGELFIPNQCDIGSPGRLFRWLGASGIEYCHVTPQLIDVASRHGNQDRKLSKLKYVFCGGDVLRAGSIIKLQKLAPQCRLVNFYGSSETPQAMVYHIIEQTGADVPLGRPIDDVEVKILDDNDCELAVGKRGQIAIETEYLADGYIESPNSMTPASKASFANFRNAKSGIRTYFTGDLGYIGPDGLLYFCGRKDDQVKIRGFRVNCSEVGAIIERCNPEISAVVLAEPGKDGLFVLVAYVTGSVDQRRLASALPAYMMPNALIKVTSIPLLQNGKVDRNALRNIGGNLFNSDKAGSFNNELLDNVATLLRWVTFDKDLSFIAMGGDSLSYISVELEIEKYLGYLPDRWDRMSFQEIANLRRKRTDIARSGGIGSALKLIGIESSILFRAIGICLVILDHIQGSVYLAGTSVLFVVSGMSFARFLMPGILASESIVPTLKFVFKFGLVAALWELVSSVGKRHIWLPDLALLGTVFPDPKQLQGPLWYLDALAQNTILLSVIMVLFSVTRRRIGLPRPGHNGAYWACFALTIIGIGLFVLQTYSGFGDGPAGIKTLLPFRWFWLLPLGATVQLAECVTMKVMPLAVIAILYAAYGVRVIVNANAVEMIGGVLIPAVFVLMIFKRMALPGLIHRAVMVLAQNSLFLYLFSGWVPNRLAPFFPKIGVPDNWIVRVVVVLGLGLSCSQLWTWAFGKIGAFADGLKKRKRTIDDEKIGEGSLPLI